MKKRLFSIQILILIPALLLLAAFIPMRIMARPTSPSSTRPQREAAVAGAMNWIHSRQRLGGDRDGAICSDENHQNCSIGGSCDIVRVAALAGEDPGGPAWTPGSVSLLDRCKLDLPVYLAREDVGRIAKVLRAAVAAGEDPRDFGGYDLITMLENHYDEETGLYHPTHLFQDALAIVALTEAGRPIPEGAIDAVIADQNPDGCWGWPIGGEVTDSDTSGMVIFTLSGAGHPDHPAVGQCISHLAMMQNEDGGWESGGIDDDDVSNANSTALVVQGLAAAGWDPEGPLFTRNRTAVAALLAFQAADGSFWWRYDQQGALLLSTEQAIQPLVMPYPNEIPKPISLYLPHIVR